MLTKQKLAIAAALSALAFGASAQTAATPSTQAADTQAAGTQGAAQSDSDTVKAAFKRADANSDGKLSREEAASLPAVAEKFTQLDKNSDGAIASDEFESGVTTGQPAATK
ncbi:MAG: EF-hand domain-containing protein [Pseudomonadota bacterium]